MKKMVVLACLLALALTLTACGGSSEDSLEGEWSILDVKDNGRDVGFREQMEAEHGSAVYKFTKDQLIMEIHGDGVDQVIECTYTAEKDQLTVRVVKATHNGQTYEPAEPTEAPAQEEDPYTATTEEAASGFSFGNVQITYTYKISGSTLTMMEGGIEYTLTRK